MANVSTQNKRKKGSEEDTDVDTNGGFGSKTKASFNSGETAIPIQGINGNLMMEKEDLESDDEAEKSSQLGQTGDEKGDVSEFQKYMNGTLERAMKRLGCGYSAMLHYPVLTPIDALYYKPRFKEKPWSKQEKIEERAYLTAEQLVAKEHELGPDVTRDMAFYLWGPLVWAGTSLEGLNMQEGDARLTELQLQIKAGLMSEGVAISVSDEIIASCGEKVEKLLEEKKKPEKKAASLSRRIDRMKRVYGVLEQIIEESSVGELTMDSLAQSFENLQRLYPKEYKHYDFSSIACSYAIPLFKRLFHGWDPLDNPTYGLEQVSKWTILLEGENSRDSLDMDSPYCLLVRKVVYPGVRSAGTSTWNAKVPRPMLRFLESWKSLLPPIVLQAIMDNVVMPKISAAVDLWDLRTEFLGCVKSLLPWLPILGDRLVDCLKCCQTTRKQRRLRKLITSLRSAQRLMKSAYFNN